MLIFLSVSNKQTNKKKLYSNIYKVHQNESDIDVITRQFNEKMTEYIDFNS